MEATRGRADVRRTPGPAPARTPRGAPRLPPALGTGFHAGGPLRCVPSAFASSQTEFAPLSGQMPLLSKEFQVGGFLRLGPFCRWCCSIFPLVLFLPRNVTPTRPRPSSERHLFSSGIFSLSFFQALIATCQYGSDSIPGLGGHWAPRTRGLMVYI